VDAQGTVSSLVTTIDRNLNSTSFLGRGILLSFYYCFVVYNFDYSLVILVACIEKRTRRTIKMMKFRHPSALVKASEAQSALYSAVSSSKEVCCRICRENDKSFRMVSPCDCSGTMSFCHQECIQEMLKLGTECPVCLKDYTFAARDPTLGLFVALLHWLDIAAVMFVFPYALLNGNWPLMVVCSTFAVLHTLFFFEFLQHPEFLVVTNKPHIVEDAFALILLVLSAVEMVGLFLYYCSFLSWSVDMTRILPSLASFIICQAFVGAVAPLVTMIAGAFSHDADDDSYYPYVFACGLLLWSMVRADLPAGGVETLVPAANVNWTSPVTTVSTWM